MKKARRFIAHLVWGLLSLGFTGVIALAVLYSYMEMQLPNVDKLKDVHLQVPLRVYTIDNKLIAQFGAKQRIPVTLDQIPQNLINAVLATEDARFYEHPGVDFIGVARAAVAVITSGKKVQGASTITMQVARNFYLSREKTYSRKIKEILLALKIDKEIGKDKILELYLNKIYFGHRAYGVASAAKVYYGRTLDQLTLAEMAMLAGLPQAPSRNNPITNPKGALKRREHVLQRMLELKHITQEQYTTAANAKLTASYHGQGIEVDAPYVAEMVREVIVDEYGEKEAYELGLTVHTTVDSQLQQAATQALRDGLLGYDQRHGYRRPTINLRQLTRDAWLAVLKDKDTVGKLQPAVVTSIYKQSIDVLLANGKSVTILWSGLSWARPALEAGGFGAKPKLAGDIVHAGDLVRVVQGNDGRWRLSQVPDVQGAIVSLNPKDGAVLALSGGFSYSLSNFNRVTQAERQPGSAFKPFIYAAALDKGYTLASIINDAPVVESDSGENSLWRPMNDTLRFYGPTPLRTGLIKSRNLVSIRLLQAIGIHYALGYIERFGFDPNTQPNSLSLALGSGSVTPIQLASAYAVFANGGYKVTPYFIKSIQSQDRKDLYVSSPKQACTACIAATNFPEDEKPMPAAPKALDPQTVYLMTQAMQGVIRHGTGRKALTLKRSDLAGKTGTTNKQMDAWFSGYTGDIVTTVWVGFDNLRTLREYGAQAALPIWIQFMRKALAGVPESLMPQPPEIVTIRIDPKTGLLAAPGQLDAKFEIFRQQYAPQTASHSDEPTIDNTNGSEDPDGHLF
jgi:penicillin-binding protein 1A